MTTQCTFSGHSHSGPNNGTLHVTSAIEAAQSAVGIGGTGARLSRVIRLGLAATSIALASCGGGGGGGGGTVIGGGGIGGTGISQGSVTGVGSIDLNGSVFRTTDATPVVIDDSQGDFATLRAQIKNGMVAKVQVSFDSNSTSTGAASNISIRDNLEGPIDAVDCPSGVIKAMGFNVNVDANTRYDGVVGCTGLSENDVIEVFGAWDNANNILASLIQRKGTLTVNTTPVEVKGRIASLTSNSFQIGTLLVNYGAGTVIDNSLGALANGQSVEVKGTMANAAGPLSASKIEGFNGAPGAASNARVEVEGLVVGCGATLPCTTFSINGQPVAVGASTMLEGGVSDDVLNGRKVEAEGIIDAGGVLQATKLQFKSGSVKIEKALADANGAGDTVSVLGILVKKNALTRDDVGINSITAGQLIRVQGYANGTDVVSGKRVVIATEIKSDGGGGGGGGGGGDRPRLQGPLDAGSKNKADSSFSILGVKVKTLKGATVFKDSRSNPTPSTPITSFDAFFDQVADGALVKARGSENPDNQIDAASSDGEIELED